MADELATRVIERHRRRLDGRARCITLDLDPTDDPTHGAQQYTLFNAYYDNWCYLPLLAFVTFDRESEQYLCAALLRHGKAVASEGTVGRSVVAVAAAAAQGVPAGALSRPSRRRLCQPGGLRLPGGAATARVRGRDGEERGVGAARRTGHAGGAGAQLVQRTDRARLHRHRRIPGRHVEPRAPRRDSKPKSSASATASRGTIRASSSRTCGRRRA